MKKQALDKNLIIVFSATALLTVAGHAVAAPGTAINAATTIGNSSFAPSSNVTIVASANTTVWCATGSHLNGNRRYWIKSDKPKIYWMTKTPGVVEVAIMAPTDDYSVVAGWSSL